MKRSYSLEEVAEAHLPTEWDGPRWLRRHLNSGELTGFQVGRVWRMTDEDIERLVNHRRNPVQVPVPREVPAEPVSFADGLSARSARRLKQSA